MTVTDSKVHDMIAHVKRECSIIDREERFRQMFDECYSFDAVGGPFSHMVPSRVLEEMDPTAFRCGVNDYMDGEDTYEIDGETYEMWEVDEAKQEFIEELEAEIEAMESEIEDDEDPDTSELEELRAALTACENYSF